MEKRYTDLISQDLLQQQTICKERKKDMITITIDKGTVNEKSIDVDRIFEETHGGSFALDADINKEIKTSSDFPDVSDFITGTEFDTIEVKNGDIVVPLQGEYNRVNSSSYEYRADGNYAFTMMIGYKAAE